MLGKKRLSFSGKLAPGVNTNSITRKGSTPLALAFQVGPAGFTGTVTDGSWIADIDADRVVKAAPAPFAGKYTLVLQGADDESDDSEPFGNGYAAVTADASGKVKLKGVLADGTKFTQSASVSESGRWPVYASLYKDQGQLLGWLTFTNASDEDITGWLHWIKLPMSGAQYYPDGFSFEVEKVTGSAYNQLATPLLDFTSGNVVLSGGNLAAPITNAVTIATNNKVSTDGATDLALSFVAGQGLFKGKVTLPGNAKATSFSGAVHQKQNTASGCFLGSSESGQVVLAP